MPFIDLKGLAIKRGEEMTPPLQSYLYRLSTQLGLLGLMIF